MLKLEFESLQNGSNRLNKIVIYLTRLANANNLYGYLNDFKIHLMSDYNFHQNRRKLFEKYYQMWTDYL